MTQQPKTDPTSEMPEVAAEIQQVQESEYDFPYHYISEFRHGFNQTFNWTWGLYHASGLAFLLEQISGFTFNSIVDIGCGDGRLVRELAIDFPDCRIVGIDYSLKAIRMAQAMNPGLDFQQMDILETTPAETFDLATLIEVLEHIPPSSARGFIEAVSRFLNPGGYLIMTVPHLNKPLEDKHFQHFTVDAVRDLTEGVFNLRRAVHFERLSLISKILNKVLTNGLFILNQPALKNAIYRFYRFRLLPAVADNGARIYLELQKPSLDQEG